MMDYWKSQFDNKKIVILGFGQEGMSTFGSSDPLVTSALFRSWIRTSKIRMT